MVKAVLAKSLTYRQGQVWKDTLRASTLPTLGNGSYTLSLLHLFQSPPYPLVCCVVPWLWLSLGFHQQVWLNPDKKGVLGGSQALKADCGLHLSCNYFLFCFAYVLFFGTNNNASPWIWHLIDLYLLDKEIITPLYSFLPKSKDLLLQLLSSTLWPSPEFTLYKC